MRAESFRKFVSAEDPWPSLEGGLSLPGLNPSADWLLASGKCLYDILSH